MWRTSAARSRARELRERRLGGIEPRRRRADESAAQAAAAVGKVVGADARVDQDEALALGLDQEAVADHSWPRARRGHMVPQLRWWTRAAVTGRS